MEDTNTQTSEKIENWSEDEVFDFISKHFQTKLPQNSKVSLLTMFDGLSSHSWAVQVSISRTAWLSVPRDRVNAEIVHFYAEKIQKMHFQNFNASWDAGRLFVLDHFILNKTKRSEVEISRPQSEVEISWPPYWNEQRRRLGTILKHPGVLHAYPPF